TLANGTAMAIANARLHAIVLAHRAELQRLSNKRIDVVEEAMRRVSRELLHPPALDDFGLIAAIESVAEKYRAVSELELRVTAPDPTIRCAAPVELMLFRTFQEALINVEKHSGARRMSVRV